MPIHKEGVSPRTEAQNRYVEMDALEPEQQARILELDDTVDRIQYLRNRIARLYMKVRAYLPTPSLEEMAEQPVGEMPDKLKRNGLTEDQSDELEIEVEQLLELYQELQQLKGIRPKGKIDPSDREAYDYYKARFHELSKSAQAIEELREAIAVQEERLNRLVAHAHAGRSIDARTHAACVARVRAEHDRLNQQLKDYIVSSPEAYLAAKMLDLQELKRHFDENGRIVETPYVKQMKDRVRDIIRNGRGVFVHGELGAGKTEFAKDFARDLWAERNPPPPLPSELRTMDTAVRRDERRVWARKLEEWKQTRAREAEPLIICGRKDMDVDAVLGARTIRRAEAISADEQTRRISEGWKQLREEFGESVKDEELTRLYHTYEQAMLESFRSPVETSIWLGPLLQAMEEGRVLIIDEMNAIPHHVLIMMNDLLLRRPGERVYPPIAGAEPFVVAEGFAVIATGNYKPEDGTMYVGRQQLDAAFLSRFGIVQYDYLPMPTEALAPGSDPEQTREYRAQAEQAAMFALRLLNGDLSMDVPEDAFGPDGQIERLARVARQLQDAFSAPEGALYPINIGGTQLNIRDILKENVLSIRHVIPILNSWMREGLSHDFDEYLFLHYIANSKARPMEMRLLYQILQTQGDFFSVKKGWPDSSDPDANKKILEFKIEDRLFRRDAVTGQRVLKPVSDAPKVEHFNARQVVEWLFGPLPERTAALRGFLKCSASRTSEQDSGDNLVEQMRREEIGRQIGKTFESTPDLIAFFEKDSGSV